ncbi:hypothetical protein [Desulfobulbus propionicus]|uniref:hypothetical protein n=1 Tax=Desulfobulbus propionicus TaxID=894 RepID=UPI00146AFB46|nr:hypothetical protein [Desulfobulbus propionicus]
MHEFKLLDAFGNHLLVPPEAGRSEICFTPSIRVDDLGLTHRCERALSVICSRNEGASCSSPRSTSMPATPTSTKATPRMIVGQMLSINRSWFVF